MGTRSEALAEQFEQAVADFTKAIESCSDADWRATTPEGWTVAALAQHVAGQFSLEKEFLDAAAGTGPLVTYTWADVNAKNDARAAANTNATKEDVLAELARNVPPMAAWVRGLSDEQLDRTAPLSLADGAPVSTEQLLLGGVLIDHVNGHLKSIEAATAGVR